MQSRPMSRHSDKFMLPLPLLEAAGACRAVIEADRWRVLDADPESRYFLIKEPFDPIAMLFHQRSKVAIFLYEEPGEATRVELHGALFGLGPLPRRRVRKVTGGLRQAIEAQVRR